jgi:hypothetical protein
MTTATTTNRRATGARVAATVAAVFALGLLATGGLLLWSDSQSDGDGYFNTDRERFAASTYALATDDIDLDGGGWMMDRDGLGRIRIEAQPRTDTPLFLGIARARDVSAYLEGTLYTSVTDFSTDPFRVDYRDRGGDRRPAPPADQRFWAASAHGSGPQALTWDIQDGDWSVVVMNADASRHVAATIRAGTKVPFLATAGWISIGAGLVLLTAAGVLVLAAVRRD